MVKRSSYKRKTSICQRLPILIAPSILSADFSRLGQEVRVVELAGADWIHIDVMDGHFVPNITIGPLVIRDIRKITRLTLDVHLMISEPERYINEFIKAGADIVTFHIEATDNPKSLVSMIKSQDVKAGVSIKPKTGLNSLSSVINDVDMVLVMTVEPGFGGQKFIKQTLSKIKKLREFYKGDIEVDGGINGENSQMVIDAGANILVAGTAVFGSRDYKKAIQDLKKGG